MKPLRNWHFSWKLRFLLFELIRPLFVKDIDSNEDFNCICSKPVLKRRLYCSRKCYEEADRLGI